MSLHSNSQYLLAAILSQLLHCGHLPVKTPSIPPGFGENVWISGCFISRLCGLVSKGSVATKYTWFHSSTLDGNIGQKMHWQEVICSDFGTAFQMDCHRLRGVNSLVCLRRLRGFILFHRLFCKGKGEMYTFYSSNILYIMFISCDEYARRHTTHWAESKPCQCGVW